MPGITFYFCGTERASIFYILYLSHIQAGNAQTWTLYWLIYIESVAQMSLPKHTVSPESSLLTYLKNGIRRRLVRKD